MRHINTLTAYENMVRNQMKDIDLELEESKSELNAILEEIDEHIKTMSMIREKHSKDMENFNIQLRGLKEEEKGVVELIEKYESIKKELEADVDKYSPGVIEKLKLAEDGSQ